MQPGDRLRAGCEEPGPTIRIGMFCSTRPELPPLAPVSGDVDDLVLAAAPDLVEILGPELEIVGAIEGAIVKLPVVQVAQALDERLGPNPARGDSRTSRTRERESTASFFSSRVPLQAVRGEGIAP